jgi:hypothetical protein
MFRGFGVFLLMAAFSALLLSWSSFPDPDAFYHAKASLLVWQHGPLLTFPWLDLTTLGSSFADHHFLFHAIEAPFVALFGLVNGARVTAVLLVALFIVTAYASFRWLDIHYAWAWTFLLAISSPLLTRLLLAKATPLALIWFVLGLAAAWKRRPGIVFAAMALFTLSHGGWPILLGSIFLLAIGEMIFQRVVEGKRWSCSYKETIAAIVGVAFGLVLHPNFPDVLSFLWIQTIKIGLGTPFDKVILGMEWLPVTPGWFVAGIAPWLIALGLGLVGLLVASHREHDRRSMSATIAFALPVAVLVALTLKSRRSVEYLIPALALWIPWIWNMVDVKRLRVVIAESFPRHFHGLVATLLLAALLGLGTKNITDAYGGLHTNRYPDAVFRDAMNAISSRATPRDRVFHSDWDEFPVLFSLDDRLRYVAGLDPTFLYEASSSLSDAYREVTWGSASASPDAVWDLVHRRLHARFIFIDRRDHTQLFETILHDPRYALLYRDDASASFEVSLP